MEEAIHILTEITQPGRWLVEILPPLRFVPAWMPGAKFKRKAMSVKQRLHGIDFFPFNWTKDKIVRCGLTIICDLLATDSDCLAVVRNLGITLTHLPPWVFILKEANHSAQKKQTLSGGVVLPCT